jgi:predicted Zn-dependent protease
MHAAPLQVGEVLKQSIKNVSAFVRAARALALADNIERDYKNDPSIWEIRAAANASRGDYRAAVKAEAKALSEAGGLGWDLAPLECRRRIAGEFNDERPKKSLGGITPSQYAKQLTKKGRYNAGKL